MITTHLQGGLGNQMFQYAFGLATAKRLGVELQIDPSSLRNDNMRQYALGLFQGVTEKIVYGTKATIHEDGLPYNQSIVDRIKDGDVLRGYWPTEKYFLDIAPEVARRFAPRQALPQIFTPYAIERIQDAGLDSTYLTIRRTDYVEKQDFHGVLPITYYRDAIQYLKDRGVNPTTIFVFSDEPDWCKEHLDIGVRFEVLGTYDMTTPTHLGREDVDLYLMSLCHHAITANSSYSMWGAWLGEHRHVPGFITAPKQWFTTNTVDSRDIVPDRWVRL